MDIRDAVDIWRKWIPTEGPAGFSRRIEISDTEVRPWVEAFVGVIASQIVYWPFTKEQKDETVEAITLLVELERGRKR